MGRYRRRRSRSSTLPPADPHEQGVEPFLVHGKAEIGWCMASRVGFETMLDDASQGDHVRIGEGLHGRLVDETRGVLPSQMQAALQDEGGDIHRVGADRLTGPFASLCLIRGAEQGIMLAQPPVQLTQVGEGNLGLGAAPQLRPDLRRTTKAQQTVPEPLPGHAA
jgi:hypothetical protein